MALPRLNENPQYELVIPSTGETVKYRPFLVKEQKVMILALESQDQRQVLNSILNCIDGCVEGVNTSSLATFDVEYIFTQIRTKSVGESTKIISKCSKCEGDNTITVDLEKIKLENEIDVKKKFVKLTDAITVELQYPTYADFLKNTSSDKSAIDMVFTLMGTCIEAVVMNDEERISIKDEPVTEVENFINSLNTEQFEKLRDFVDNIPKITLDIDYNCESCGESNNKKLEGLNDFFS